MCVLIKADRELELKASDNTLYKCFSTRVNQHICLIVTRCNGTMSADIFKRKMAHAIQLKWTFLALKWAVFCLEIVSNFSKKATPANSKQNLNIMQLR